MQYRWNVKEETRKGRPHGPYAVAAYTVAGRMRIMYMHKLITGWPRTDHKNHNGLDNRRENLRPATHTQNQQNTRPRVIVGTSRYKGVCWSKRERKWRAVIKFAGVQRHLGYFADEEDAARAYDAAARKYHGEFACLNFPDDNAA